MSHSLSQLHTRNLCVPQVGAPDRTTASAMLELLPLFSQPRHQLSHARRDKALTAVLNAAMTDLARLEAQHLLTQHTIQLDATAIAQKYLRLSAPADEVGGKVGIPLFLAKCAAGSGSETSGRGPMIGSSKWQSWRMDRSAQVRVASVVPRMCTWHTPAHTAYNNHVTHCITSLTSHHITSHHITSRHVTSRHVTSRHVTSRHVTPRHATSRHVMSRHITSHHITHHSHHITSHHAGDSRPSCPCTNPLPRERYKPRTQGALHAPRRARSVRQQRS